ncbi:hypothetical protein AXF42_Ash006647 [Apostasia shenzhenica]|uniref:Uncharacterized protein n=1 Tax=Apostasia shenzhenica TaxID=1088818 RepID=A0A2I0AIU5_9ASPA|nr:hypothetical protein AXF42_Ash006647 [Apostasia shenzhenica]
MKMTPGIHPVLHPLVELGGFRINESGGNAGVKKRKPDACHVYSIRPSDAPLALKIEASPDLRRRLLPSYSTLAPSTTPTWPPRARRWASRHCSVDVNQLQPFVLSWNFVERAMDEERSGGSFLSSFSVKLCSGGCHWILMIVFGFYCWGWEFLTALLLFSRY